MQRWRSQPHELRQHARSHPRRRAGRLPGLRARVPGELVMTTAGWIQLLVFLGLIVVFTPILGGYMAKVWAGGKAPGDRVFGPIERLTYRVCGIDPDSEQRWTTYTFSLLAVGI